MGQYFSSTKNHLEKIDNIATNYILTTSFTDMQNLSKADYCSKTTLITKSILSTLPTVQVDELYNKKIDTYILNNGADVMQDKEQKCIKIAQFYTLVAHIFAAIKKTFIINSENQVDGNGNICQNRKAAIMSVSNSNDISTPMLDELLKFNYTSKHGVTDTEMFNKSMLDDKIAKNQARNAESSVGAEASSVGAEASSVGAEASSVGAEASSVGAEAETGPSDWNGVGGTTIDENINAIEHQVLAAQIKLIKVLNILFIKTSTKPNGLMYALNPKLTMAELERAAKTTRITLSTMYIGCEDIFTKHVKAD